MVVSIVFLLHSILASVNVTRQIAASSKSNLNVYFFTSGITKFLDKPRLFAEKQTPS